MDIRNDRLEGLSYTEIARKYHIDPRTAKRYAEALHRRHTPPTATITADGVNADLILQENGEQIL